jgi:hypothetical protein
MVPAGPQGRGHGLASLRAHGLGRRTAVLGILALCLGGCAFSDLTLAPPRRPEDAPASRRGANRAIVVMAPFTDARPQSRCGMKKNGYNSESADVFCQVGPDIFLPRLLAEELRAAGFHVLVDRSRAGPEVPVVRGVVEQLFVEPKVGFFSSAMEADVAIVLRVELPHGRVAIRRFFAKGAEATLLSPDENMALAQSSAVREMMLNSVGALANLLDRLPPGPTTETAPATPSASGLSLAPKASVQ